MTGIYQDHLLQEMRKTRIAMERIAKSLEGINRFLNTSGRVPSYTPNPNVFAINEPVDLSNLTKFSPCMTDVRTTDIPKVGKDVPEHATIPDIDLTKAIFGPPDFDFEEDNDESNNAD